ncbi:hypothetical protein LTS17_012723 [Exophiala oligosperma]
MAPLMNLPLDVLQTIPWDESDLSSVVLTCRLFHQLFTPRLYEIFTAEEVYRPCAGWHREFSFLRTIRNNPTLAAFVREISLTLGEVEFWDHEEFRQVARDFGIAADFDIVALPADTNHPKPIDDAAPEEGNQQLVVQAAKQRLRRKYGSNQDAEGNSYRVEQFWEDFACSILSKLPQIRRLSLTYDEIKLFDSFSHFAHLEEVEMGSLQFQDVGDKLFEDAVRLLGLPKIRKWSLSCAEIYKSAIRCIPPQSSPVQEMSISCPHIPAREFHYLMAIPRALKAFRWRLKAWTCYPVWASTPPAQEQLTGEGRDVDDGDPGSGNHHEDTIDSASEWATECQTLSSASMFSCLRRLQTSLEEITRVDGDELADLVTHVSAGISTLREIILHNTIHLDDAPDIEEDSARKHRPMTTKRYYELRGKCDSLGVSLVSCCYEACLEEIVQSAQGFVHSDQIPSDMAMDESAAAQSWQGMYLIGQSMMSLDAMRRSYQSELPA